MAVPLSTTFGIEIEFVVVGETGQYDDQLSLHQHVIDILREAGFSVNSLSAATNYENWTIGADGSIIATEEIPPLPQWYSPQCIGLELRTPAFFWSQSDAAFEQLGRVLAIIQQNFKTFTNQSCGLHVHVGNRELGFPLGTLRKFAHLTLVFEKQLASLHPYHRVNNIHCRAPSSNFHGRDIIKNLTKITKTKHTKSLVERMSSNRDGARRGFAYNMINLLGEGPKVTIEFRQHEATLDVYAIFCWTSLACTLVERSHFIDLKDLVGLLRQPIDNEAYSVLDFLDALGMRQLAAYYGQRGLADVDMNDDSDGSFGLSDVDESDGIPSAPERPRQQSRTTESRCNNDSMVVDSNDTSRDGKIARRLELGLRPQAKRVRKATPLAETTHDPEDWELWRALHEEIREEDHNEGEDMDYE